MWYIHTMGYYSAINKNEIMLFAATWIELEIPILSEIRKSEKDKCLSFAQPGRYSMDFSS